MSDKLKTYFDAVSSRKAAEKWSAMAKNGGGRNGDSFSMSTALSLVKLTRCGQYDTGGKNYWETSKEFNDAIVQWIKENLEDVQAGAIEILKQKEDAALRNCQSFLDEMQQKVNEVKRRDSK